MKRLIEEQLNAVVTENKTVINSVKLTNQVHKTSDKNSINNKDSIYRQVKVTNGSYVNKGYE